MALGPSSQIGHRELTKLTLCSEKEKRTESPVQTFQSPVESTQSPVQPFQSPLQSFHSPAQPRGGWTQQNHVMLSALCVVRAPLLYRASRSKHKVVIILEKGEKHSYNVPSFSVVTAMLREVSNRFWVITAPGK